MVWLFVCWCVCVCVCVFVCFRQARARPSTSSRSACRSAVGLAVGRARARGGGGTGEYSGAGGTGSARSVLDQERPGASEGSRPRGVLGVLLVSTLRGTRLLVSTPSGVARRAAREYSEGYSTASEYPLGGTRRAASAASAARVARVSRVTHNAHMQTAVDVVCIVVRLRGPEYSHAPKAAPSIYGGYPW